LVVAIAVVKTIAPVLLGGWLLGRYYDLSLLGRAVAGFFVMLGHCFPIFHEFKGGKGVMAAGAIVFLLNWRMAIVSWATFILVTALTRYVSLGAMLGAATFPVTLYFFGDGGFSEFAVVLMCAVLIIARHHANIRRLAHGEESRFTLKRQND